MGKTFVLMRHFRTPSNTHSITELSFLCPIRLDTSHGGLRKREIHDGGAGNGFQTYCSSCNGENKQLEIKKTEFYLLDLGVATKSPLEKNRVWCICARI